MKTLRTAARSTFTISPSAVMMLTRRSSPAGVEREDRAAVVPATILPSASVRRRPTPRSVSSRRDMVGRLSWESVAKRARAALEMRSADTDASADVSATASPTWMPPISPPLLSDVTSVFIARSMSAAVGRESQKCRTRAPPPPRDDGIGK